MDRSLIISVMFDRLEVAGRCAIEDDRQLPDWGRSLFGHCEYSIMWRISEKTISTEPMFPHDPRLMNEDSHTWLNDEAITIPTPKRIGVEITSAKGHGDRSSAISTSRVASATFCSDWQDWIVVQLFQPQTTTIRLSQHLACARHYQHGWCWSCCPPWSTTECHKGVGKRS